VGGVTLRRVYIGLSKSPDGERPSGRDTGNSAGCLQAGEPVSREPSNVVTDLARIDVRSVEMKAGASSEGADGEPWKTFYRALTT
jgi:hypothetical protein